MALPWLIGAAVVALGAAAVSAFSDDSDSGSGGNGDEERRRRERAEQERKARAHKEKLESMKEAFVQEGMQRANELQQSLDGQIKVILLGDKPFKAILDDDDEEFHNPVSPTYVEVYDLQFLPQETQDYLVKLESLYDVELEPEEVLMNVPVRLKEIDHKLAQLKALREKL
ncbi:hypothetical protein [Shewanella baltica]|uniref:hypothetical protein n=1 Tax=Shewanella baltica TaxID=62322 RepID=UPI0024B8AB51|nr:hypothetical protein [Shewanella baltica]